MTANNIVMANEVREESKRIEYVDVVKDDVKLELCVVLCFKHDWRVYKMTAKGYTANWEPAHGRKFATFLQAIEFVEGLGYELVTA